MYETHTFQTIRTNRYGIQNPGTHNETIHVSVTHLVEISIDAGPGELDVLLIRAWSLAEAREIVASHQRGQIWERHDDRSFSPFRTTSVAA